MTTKDLEKEQLAVVWNLILAPLKTIVNVQSDSQLATRFFGLNSESARSVLSRMKSGTASLPKYQERVQQGLDKLDARLYLDRTGQVKVEFMGSSLDVKLKFWEGDTLRHFTYFYGANKPPRGRERDFDSADVFAVRQAHVVHNEDSGEVVLIYYNKQTISALENTDDFSGIISGHVIGWYCGRWHKEDKTNYLLYNHKFDRVHGRKAEHHGLTVFEQPHLDLDWGSYFPTTFASLGPACGIGVLHYTSREEVLMGIIDNQCPSSVAHLLRGKSYSAIQHRELFDLDKHQEIVEVGTQLEGTYYGYSISSVPPNQGINVSVWEVYNGFELRYRSHFAKVEKTGYLSHLHNGSQRLLVAEINYHRESDFYGLRLHIDPGVSARLPSLPPGCILGAYGGISSGYRDPMAGRLLLVKSQQPVAFEDMEEKVITLNKVNEIDRLFSAKPFLTDFFNGKLEAFHDGPSIYRNPVFESLFRSLNEARKLKRQGGTFLSLRKSSSRDVVYQKPMFIHNFTAKATRVYAFEGEDRIKLIGRINMINSVALTINFDRKVSEHSGDETLIADVARRTEISLGPNPWGENEIRIGQTLLMTDRNEPVSFKEVFIKIGGKIPPIESLICEYKRHGEMPETTQLCKIVEDLFDDKYSVLR